MGDLSVGRSGSTDGRVSFGRGGSGGSVTIGSVMHYDSSNSQMQPAGSIDIERSGASEASSRSYAPPFQLEKAFSSKTTDLVSQNLLRAVCHCVADI